MPRLSRARFQRYALSSLALLPVLAIIWITGSAPGAEPAPSDRLTPAALVVSAPQAVRSHHHTRHHTHQHTGAGTGWTPPAHALLSTDPLHAPHRLARDLARYVDAVPAGASIKVETFYLDSPLTTRALIRAFDRGVDVQIIVSRWHHEHYPDETRLARLLGTDRHDASWLHWSDGSSRGGGDSTVDHDKVWRFSEVGRRRWVTFVGSYNNGRTSDRHAYALGLVVADEQIYRAFERMWHQSRADRPVRRTDRSFRGRDWDAYFLPGTHLTPAADPAVRRLRAIPARPTTRLRIRMFSMFGVRGSYVADQLDAMARRGTRITLVAGPSVEWDLQQRMRSAGIDVQGGCWPDGTFDHAKDMDATWLTRDRRGRRVYETWVGSDNWDDNNYLYADQVDLGVTGRSLFERFNRIFATVVRRRDVAPWQC